nr:DUF2252 family protein [Polymorphobacter sp.]
MAKFDMPKTVAERDELLTRSRTLKMARSTHAYVRGNTALFYTWLLDSKVVRDVPAGPPVWICGDCHLGNLGPLADNEGRIAVQIRDLDQTVIGNPAHDLIRLGLSLASAARSADLPGVTTAHMIEQMIVGYSRALAEPDDIEAILEPADIRTIRRRARSRRWRHLAEERLQDVRPSIPIGKRFWDLIGSEREALAEVIAGDEIRELIRSFGGRDEEVELSLLDAAYWKKGCSSLGKMRFAALIGISRQKHNDEYALIDLKEAVESVAPTTSGSDMPSDAAQRVVTGAKALSPNLGNRMAAATMLGAPVVVRELMPQDLKLEIDQFSRAEAAVAARYLAHVVGIAHARQMDEATRREWRAELDRRHSATLDAPTWLWSSVVELAAAHEAAYLNHCREYAARA